jgi:hypothetical protein
VRGARANAGRGISFARGGCTVASRPARFLIKGQAYVLSIHFADYRVGPIDADAIHSEREERLAYLKQMPCAHA